MTCTGRPSGSGNDDIVAALNDILTQLQAQAKDAELLTVCALPATTPPTRFLVEAVYDQVASVWNYTRPDSTVVVLGADFELCGETVTPDVEEGQCRVATAAGVGYAVDDLLQEYLFWDTTATPRVLIETQWRNVTQQALLAAPPVIADTAPCSPTIFFIVGVQCYEDGAGGRYSVVAYDDGSTLIFDRDAPATTFTEVGAGWALVDCGVQQDLSGLATAANQVVTNTVLAGIQTDQNVGNAALATIVAAMADDATAANQVAANTSLAAILAALGSKATATNQTTANTTLSSILAAMADDATAANQTANTDKLEQIRVLIAGQTTGAIPLVCADGAPALLSFDETGVATFLNATGSFSPTTWTPGPCPDVDPTPTPIAWTPQQIVPADNLVTVDPTYGVTAVLFVDPPTEIDYAVSYGEIDGLLVYPGYSMADEVPDSNSTLAHTVDFQAYGNARWVVRVA